MDVLMEDRYKATTENNTDFTGPPPEGLMDIRDVSVDKSLDKEERIAEFVRQIKNPYLFRCGKFTVRARFADNGVSLEECLQGILR